MNKAMLSAWMSIAEAAQALGVSRQRVAQLAADGRLPSSRVGRQIVVRREDVDARRSAPPGSGRHFSPRRAWALIFLAEGVAVAGLDAVVRSRLRSVLRRSSLWSLRHKLSSRSVRMNLRAHHSDIPRLLADPAVVRSGLREASEAGMGLVAPDAPIELYVSQGVADRLLHRYALRASLEPNVLLRVVPDEVVAWFDGSIAPRAAIALDIAEDHDARSQQSARELLANV